MKRVLPIVLLMGLAGGCTGQDTPNTRDASAATVAAPQLADWVTYNGPLAGDRFSPLKQITAANVSQLQQKCVFDTPMAASFAAPATRMCWLSMPPTANNCGTSRLATRRRASRCRWRRSRGTGL